LNRLLSVVTPGRQLVINHTLSVPLDVVGQVMAQLAVDVHVTLDQRVVQDGHRGQSRVDALLGKREVHETVAALHALVLRNKKQMNKERHEDVKIKRDVVK
jgi:hypothetical protein